ncbi:MAG: hypothetical protein QW230_04155 [Thermofilum sp.]
MPTEEAPEPAVVDRVPVGQRIGRNLALGVPTVTPARARPLQLHQVKLNFEFRAADLLPPSAGLED